MHTQLMKINSLNLDHNVYAKSNYFGLVASETYLFNKHILLTFMSYNITSMLEKIQKASSEC